MNKIYSFKSPDPADLLVKPLQIEPISLRATVLFLSAIILVAGAVLGWALSILMLGVGR